MSLRLRFTLGVILLILVSFAGTWIIVKNLNTLRRNQEIVDFKDQIYHNHEIARGVILSAQTRLYQHQAGYSRDIDEMVNHIMRFESLIEAIPEVYRDFQQPFCGTCHDDSASRIDGLARTLADLQLVTDKYREHISVLITTSDPEAQLFHHARASSYGENIADTITVINHSAARMIDELLYSNEKLFTETLLTIKAAMAILILISAAIMAYTFWTLNRLVSSLLTGTESIAQDDFSLRLPVGDEKDEFGLLASRFNVMAEHLQQRDQEIQKKARELESANRQLRDLNENLELKIHGRTAELEYMVEQLQSTTAALEESKRRLETANVDLLKANQAKSNFLSIVSHELKTPLSVINGFLSLILDERYQSDPKNLREAVEISRRRGQQLARMIDELIDLSRLDARAMVLHKEPMNMSEAITEVTEQFQEDIQRKQIQILTEDFSSLNPVTCDPDKIKQVITNLISNAVKFSQEGSKIKLGFKDNESDFLFSCRDEGIGLQPKERDKIFEKFYQVDSTATRRFGGAGLGLSIVKEIIQLHGGRIWVESEEGKGCTFFFTLPKEIRAPMNQNLING